MRSGLYYEKKFSTCLYFFQSKCGLRGFSLVKATVRPRRRGSFRPIGVVPGGRAGGGGGGRVLMQAVNGDLAGTVTCYCL